MPPKIELHTTTVAEYTTPDSTLSRLFSQIRQIATVLCSTEFYL